ncbi:MAG TPA: alpha-ketoglutarate-dependent dioxygenase AlkB [Anaeromyxobacteraceae bacterium]|nr:alpha-ketoglutarate-dependent dioxygenase AlkB [Anaeromyxobacteraceae bacterium]
MLQSFQFGLFAQESASLDAAWSTLRRVWLDDQAWIDHAPGWVRGSDRLFFEILASYRWGQRTRWMYDRRVREPRLTAWWELGSGEPLRVPILEEMRLRLSDRYGEVFDSVGFNLYRSGRDSVAWHGDKIEEEIAEPVVALVSLGEPRRFLLRPRGGGRSVSVFLGRGDLLVTGGTTQRTWDHCVPKVARAGPRISVAFRHGLDRRAYARKRVVEPDDPVG